MKAIVCRTFTSLDDLELAEIAAPVLLPGHVRIRVKAAGLNFPDTLVVQGKYQIKPDLPFVPGSEFAGTVAEAAEDVDAFAPGARVFGLCPFGALAEEIVVPAERLQPMDDRLNFAMAAILPMAYGAAMHALFDRGEIQEGQTLMILGATGGVGLAAVEIAALAGAQVLAVDGDDLRLDLARDRGARAVWNYQQGSLREAARAFAGDDGFDLILDPVGGALGEEAVRCLAWGGRLLVFGFASGAIPAIRTNLLLLKGAEARGVFWGEAQRRRTAHDATNFRRLMAWWREGRIRPQIGATYPLSRGIEALRGLAEGRHPGKIAVLAEETRPDDPGPREQEG